MLNQTRIIAHSISQHSTTWWSDGRLVRKGVGLRALCGTLCFTSQRSTTWWSDGKFVRKEAGLKAQCGTLYSTSQRIITWWSNGRLVRKEAGLRAQCGTLCFTSQHSTTWRSDESLWGRRRGLELSVEPSIPPVNTVPHGSQMESLWGMMQGLELNVEPSIPPVNALSHGGLMESLWARKQGLELSTKPSTTCRFINQHWRGANGTLRSAKDSKAHPQNPATWQLHKNNLVPGNQETLGARIWGKRKTSFTYFSPPQSAQSAAQGHCCWQGHEQLQGRLGSAWLNTGSLKHARVVCITVQLRMHFFHSWELSAWGNMGYSLS